MWTRKDSRQWGATTLVVAAEFGVTAWNYFSRGAPGYHWLHTAGFAAQTAVVGICLAAAFLIGNLAVRKML